jgi:hypothetical protein
MKFMLDIKVQSVYDIDEILAYCGRNKVRATSDTMTLRIILLPIDLTQLQAFYYWAGSVTLQFGATLYDADLEEAGTYQTVPGGV